MTEHPSSVAAPVVSVVIPTYNYAHFLGRAISSVLTQSFSSLELIVVDDGSLDETENVVQQFAGDGRLVYLWQENKGLSSARNAGVNLARGCFIAFLDADDEWCSDKLQSQLAVISPQPRVGLVYGACEYVDRDGKVLQRQSAHHRGDLFLPLLRSNLVRGTSSTILVRRECFTQLGGFSTELTACEDWHIAVRIAAHWQIDFVEQVVARITVHQSSMSQNIERQARNTVKMISLLQVEFASMVSEHVWRQARSYAHLSVGRTYGLAGDLTRARRFFFRALCEYPANVAALTFLTASCLGPTTYAWLRRVKRSVVPDHV